MPSDPRCVRVRAELEEAFAGRRAPAPAARAHADTCADCAAERRALAGLERALAALPTPRASDALVAQALARASDALHEPAAASPVTVTGPGSVPPGYRRQLARAVAGALLSLPVVLAWNAGVLYLGAGLLEGVLSGPLRLALGAGYTAAAAGWLSVVAGSLPFLALRSARGSTPEVAA